MPLAILLSPAGTAPSVETYTYQWQTSPDGTTAWTNISLATAATYAPVAGDVGKFLRVQVTATDDGGSTTVSTAATAAVTAQVVNVSTTSLQPGGQLKISPS